MRSRTARRRRGEGDEGPSSRASSAETASQPRAGAGAATNRPLPWPPPPPAPAAARPLTLLVEEHFQLVLERLRVPLPRPHRRGAARPRRRSARRRLVVTICGRPLGGPGTYLESNISSRAPAPRSRLESELTSRSSFRFSLWLPSPHSSGPTADS